MSRAVVARGLALAVATTVTAAVSGCGDNSKDCGEGTIDRNGDGLCEPDDRTGELTCGAGTMPDVAGSMCVPDPSICAEGQTLVNGACLDPVIDVDVEEGAEPNGLAPTDVPAGLVMIDTPTATTSIHGCLVPPPGEADFDSYRVHVDGPRLLTIDLTGIAGPTPGFLARAVDVAELPQGFERVSVALGAATSMRELFLPATGWYSVSISDGRSLAGVALGEPFSPAAPDCYFATIAAAVGPVDVPLAFNTSTRVQAAGTVDAYAITAASGTMRIMLAFDDTSLEPALDVYVDGVLVQAATTGLVQLTGLAAGQSVRVIVDTRYDVGLAPSTYRFAVGP